MDISITYRDGWALLTDVSSRRTAITIPKRDPGPPESLNFIVVGWHDSYEDAYEMVGAMQALDYTVAEHLSLNPDLIPEVIPALDPPPPPPEEPPAIEPPPPHARRRRPRMAMLPPWSGLLWWLR